MSLAQVVYNISTDTDFATLWRNDPDQALSKRGLQLSKEEKAFLVNGLKPFNPAEGRKIRLAEIGTGLSWLA